MKLDPQKVKFVSPLSPGVFVRPLRFVGREKTVQLQETALVVEGNVLKVGLLGIEMLFRRALAEWSSVTVPYSRITRVKYARFPLFRLLALLYLIGWPTFSLLVAVGPGGVAGGLTGFLIGTVPAALAVYVFVRVPPRYVIDFRARDGARTRLMMHVRGTKLRRAFAARLAEYREAAKKFRTADPRPPRNWRRAAVVAGLGLVFLLFTAGVAYLGWAFVLPRLGQFELPGPNSDRNRAPSAPSTPGGGGGAFVPPAPQPLPQSSGGTATPFACERLPADAATPLVLKAEPTNSAGPVWLPDGRLATAAGGAVRVYDLAAGRGVAYTLGREWNAVPVALAPDTDAPAGVRAAVGILGRGMFVWSVGSPAAPEPLPGSDGFASSAAFGPTGRGLLYATPAGEGGALSVWDTRTRTRVARVELGSFLTTTPSVSAGARVALVETTSHELVLWAPDAPARRRRGYAGAAVSPDGAALAVRTAGGKPAVRVADATGEKVVWEAPANPLPAWLAFAPGGRVLAAGGDGAGGNGATFWDAASGKPLGRVAGGSFLAQDGRIAPDGTALAVGDFSAVTVWRLPPAVAAAVRGEALPAGEAPPPRPVVREPAPAPRPAAPLPFPLFRTNGR